MLPKCSMPQDIPKKAVLTSAHKVLPEFISVDARLAVCSEIYELLETLEPNVHQFFPISICRESGRKPILRRDGTELATPYYLVNILNRFDPVLIERSDVIVLKGVGGRPDGVFANLNGKKDVVLSKKMVAGHHL